MFITNEKRVLLVPDYTPLSDVLKLVARRLNIPDFRNDAPNYFSDPEIRDTIARKIADRKSIGEDGIDRLQELFAAVDLPNSHESLIIKKSSIGDTDAFAISVSTPSALSEPLTERLANFPSVKLFLYGTLAVNESEFMDVLCTEAIKDAVTGDYNTMLLLGSLYEAGVLNLTKMTDTSLLPEETSLLDILSGYGYDSDILGDVAVRVILNEYLPKTENQNILLYAQNPKDAIKIIGDHMDVNNAAFILTKNRNKLELYIVPDIESAEDPFFSNIVLTGQVSDYTGKQSTKHSIKI